jgi:hypothetical protein
MSKANAPGTGILSIPASELFLVKDIARTVSALRERSKSLREEVAQNREKLSDRIALINFCQLYGNVPRRR